MVSLEATDLRPARKETFRQPKTSLASILPLLLTLATARQADFGEAAQKTYCRGLDGFTLEDIQAAVARLALSERPEGRSAMPSLGELVSACQNAGRRRHEAEAQAKRKVEADYARANPSEFCTLKEITDELHMKRAKCEQVFGSNYRDRMHSEYGDDGKYDRRLTRNYGLCELYLEATSGN